MVLTIIIFWLVVINLYHQFWTQKPKGLVNLEEYYNQVKSKGKLWEVLQVFSVPFILLYNQFILTVHLIQGVFQVVAWCFQNFVVDGLFLLVRILFHYLIMWPWNLLLLAFNQIRTSWSWKMYKTAAIGLSVTLAVAFLGQFVSAQFGLSKIIDIAFSALSVIPFAYSLARISELRHAGQETEGVTNRGILGYLGVFIGLMVGLTAVGLAILYVGSLGIPAPFLTSLLSGGGIFLSGLLIVNAIIVFFFLSVFPQHLLHSQNTNKELVLEVLRHLGNRWPQYILGGLFSLIPGALLSLLPAFLLSGAVYLSGNSIDNVLAQRMAEKKAKFIEANKHLKVDNLLDESVTLEAAQEKLKEYAYQKQLEIDHDVLATTRGFVVKELGDYSAPYSAAPLAGVAAEGLAFYTLEKSALEMSPARSRQGAQQDEDKFKTSLSGEEDKMDDKTKSLRRDLDGGKARLDELQRELDKVCAECEPTVPERQLPKNPVLIEPKEKIDYCEVKRQFFLAQIEEQEKVNKVLQGKLDRLSVLKEDLIRLHEDLSDQKAPIFWMFTLSHLILGLWISLIVGLMAAFFLIVWSNTNYAIYHLKGQDGAWYVSEEIQKVNNRSRHQPVLGFLPLVLLAGLLVFGGAASKLKKFIPSINISMDDSKSSAKSEDKSQSGEAETSDIISEAAAEDSQDPAEEAMEGFDTSMADVDAVLMEMNRAEAFAEAEAALEDATGAEAADDAGSPYNYLIYIGKFTSNDEAEELLSKFQDQLPGLRVVPPGSFLGDNNQFYLVCPVFGVDRAEMERCRQVLRSKGISFESQQL